MNFLFPIFNIILGFFFLLIGLRVYSPFRKEKKDYIHNQYGTFFKIGGIGLFFWGAYSLLQVLNF
ncbi:hypothetical protein ACUNWD_11155 [Sunxiuqinia sp. A32]|uniref:hypothetical protein n=1 Tax=Sunxiuqinia sp. A32 TaxID=3461496 RepID=UPI004045C158